MSDGFEQVSIIKNQVREILRKKAIWQIVILKEITKHGQVSMLVQRINLPIQILRSSEDAYLQNRYRVDGFKQDFAEWFEWEIENGEVKEE